MSRFIYIYLHLRSVNRCLMYVLLTSIKEIDSLISKVISNIHLKFTIEKNRRCQDFKFPIFPSPGQFMASPNSHRYH